MKKFFKKKDNSTLKSLSRSSSRNPSKSSSNHKNNSRKAKAYIGKEMDSDEEESSDSKEFDESDEDSDSSMAGIAYASSPTTNFFGNPSSCRRSGIGGTQICLPVAQCMGPSTALYGPDTIPPRQDPREGPGLARRTTRRPPEERPPQAASRGAEISMQASRLVRP